MKISFFLSQTFLPLLKMAAKKNSDKPQGITRCAVINVSSLLGSLADNVGGKFWAYRESKTALNMFSKNLAKELSSDGIVVIALHPGHVRTNMGGPSGKISTEESVSGIYKVMLSLNESKTDKFLQWDGKELPW